MASCAFRATMAATGAVVALPHSGNWDLAGAWACVTRLPVTTVAEALPNGDFESFLRFRERLGMEVLSHRDPGALIKLIGAVRRGRLVCLLADRDLAGRGLPVRWRGHPITMPAGPGIGGPPQRRSPGTGRVAVHSRRNEDHLR